MCLCFFSPDLFQFVSTSETKIPVVNKKFENLNSRAPNVDVIISLGTMLLCGFDPVFFKVDASALCDLVTNRETQQFLSKSFVKLGLKCQE